MAFIFSERASGPQQFNIDLDDDFLAYIFWSKNINVAIDIC